MNEYRGLSKVCFQMIERDEGLRALLKRASDAPYRLEVRHNYLNCYYQSGSVFKLEFKVRDERLAFEFNSNYFSLKGVPNSNHEELLTWVRRNPNDPREWLANMDGLREVMDAWMEKNPCEEARSQQTLTGYNTFARGSYQYIDTELRIPQHLEMGKMDLIAVRREGERYVPVIVELKYSTKQFYGPSGIEDHYRKTMLLLNHPEGESYLVETIRRIWDSKIRLGMPLGPVPDTDAFDKAELMVAVTNWKNGDPAVIRGYLPNVLDRKVWAAISEDRKLYFDRAEPLPEKAVD